MKMSKLVGRRIKEDPKDALTASHKFIIRGGYARLVSAGIYSLLPLGRKITKKIETIIREEMDAIEGQEILMPVVLPKDLWDESGRYESVGDELLRFKDRNGKGMLLAMTHEEAVVHLIRTEVNSYKQLPFMVYQLQRKYRDEARPRAGLIRVREFTMKDGYSFHETQECLDEYYYKAHQAYENIFNRVGLNETISIKSDSGMMGGAVSHEFMALSESGEDTLFISPDGQYKANREIATASLKFEKEDEKELEKVHTPGKKSIEEIARYLGVRHENTGKAVFYTDGNDHLIFVMIRGDFEVNENKVKKYLKTSQLEFASDELIIASGAQPGYASPIGIDREKVTVLVDRSVAESSNLVVGANEEDYHFKNFNFKRDMVEAEIIDLATVRAGDPCPVTGEPLEEKRGIEVGNIFQLGTKYSDAMNCKFLDKNGKAKSMIMGCYGIGVERTMASVIEQSYDNWGPIWPITIAPYHVHLCALNIKKEEVRTAADKIYNEFIKAGIEILYDDRGEKAGFMFNDADLIGIPFRIIISTKTLEENAVELKVRGDKGDKKLLEIDNLKVTIQDLINEELSKYNK
ncbi:MAG: proline--tRNA ligase [bacterium]|nr:proline--tRNA ligase [bacterium]